MKIFIFIALTVWSFSGNLGADKRIVSSPEEAAIIVWQRENRKTPIVEPDRYVYELWEVDLSGSQKTVKQIPIPELYFRTECGKGK